MFKKFLILIIMLSCEFTFLNAEVVEKIIVSGNKRISEETIKVWKY